MVDNIWIQISLDTEDEVEAVKKTLEFRQQP